VDLVYRATQVPLVILAPLATQALVYLDTVVLVSQATLVYLAGLDILVSLARLVYPAGLDTLAPLVRLVSLDGLATVDTLAPLAGLVSLVGLDTVDLRELQERLDTLAIAAE
jgi:hypothetical protein